MILHMSTPYAHDGQVGLIQRLLAERNWESTPALIPIMIERAGAIEMALHVLTRGDLREPYIVAGVLTAEQLGAQLNQVMTFVSTTPGHLGHRARLVWAPLDVPEAFSMIRWLLAVPAKGGEL